MSLSVFIVSPFVLPHIGGIEAHTEGLAIEMTKRNHVLVITQSLSSHSLTTPEGKYPKIEMKAKILLGRLPVPIPLFGAIARLYRLIRDAQPDGVIVQSHLFPISLMALVICKLTGTNSILVGHASGSIVTGSRFLDLAVRFYDYAARRICTWAASKVVGVTRASSVWLVNDDSPCVIPNAIDTGFLPGSEDVAPLSQRPDTVIMVSRLVPGKRVLEAAQALASSSAIAEIRIIGDGPMAPLVEKYALREPKVKFLGPQPRETVLAELRQARFFVHASDYPDGLPTVLLEAAASGAYICASGAGVKELLTDDQGVYGLEYGDFEELREVIENSRSNEAFLQKQVNTLRQKVEQSYSWAEVSVAFESLIFNAEKREGV